MIAALDILYVDDEPRMRHLVREAFAESPVPSNVHGVGSARETLRFLDRGEDSAETPRPDLVVLDRDLGDASGLDVLGDLRANPALASVPIVVFTSSDDARHVATAYERGANAFVRKPADFDGLVSFADGAANFWGSAPAVSAPA